MCRDYPEEMRRHLRDKPRKLDSVNPLKQSIFGSIVLCADNSKSLWGGFMMDNMAELLEFMNALGSEFQKTLWPLANSAFVTSLMGSLAGAFAGAVAAQNIAERSRYSKDLQREIRSTNAAIAIAFTVCNTAISLKKQHISRIKTSYDLQKNALINFERDMNDSKLANREFKYDADLNSLEPPFFPTAVLQDLILERLSLIGRPLHLANVLIDSARILVSLIERRNNLITSFRVMNSEGKNFSHRYFGQPCGEGHIDLEFAQTIENLFNTNDDIIFFSQLLCVDLRTHGTLLVEQYEKRFKAKSPQVSDVKFDKAVKEGLIPSEERYKDWLSAFKKHQ